MDPDPKPIKQNNVEGNTKKESNEVGEGAAAFGTKAVTYNWFMEELVFVGRDKRKTVGGPKEDPKPKCEQRWHLPGNLVGEASFACAEGAHYVDSFANERTGCKGRQTNETPTQHRGRWD